MGANISEGYLRYHYLDKIKFYYISRASLAESCTHWLELLYKRGKAQKDKFEKMKAIQDKLAVKLNNLIGTTYKQKENKK